jgi:hypothetical protein
LSADKFLAAFQSALARGDVAGIKAALDRIPGDPALADALKVMMSNPSANPATQRYAAEALMRIGTAESVQYVLGQLLSAYRSGDENRANTLLASLEAPTSGDLRSSVGSGQFRAFPGSATSGSRLNCTQGFAGRARPGSGRQSGGASLS